MQGSFEKSLRSRKNKHEESEELLRKKKGSVRRAPKQVVEGKPAKVDRFASLTKQQQENPLAAEFRKTLLEMIDHPELIEKKIPGKIASKGDDVDTSGAINPFRAANSADMQRDMDQLNTEPDMIPAIAPETAAIEAEEQKHIDTEVSFREEAEKSQKPEYDVVAEDMWGGEPPQENYAVEYSTGRSFVVGGENKKIEEKAGDGREEPTINLDALKDFVEPAAPEGTPKEWREKLRGLITGAKEKVEWWKNSEEKLSQRSEELDAQLEKIGGVEKSFRWLGENYNKLNWKTKLAVGAGLGLGAAVTAGVSLPLTFGLMSGLAAQRIAGLSTMFLKFEKGKQDEKWNKEKALLKAAMYTVFMGAAIKEGVELASDTEAAHMVQQWLGEHLGHHAPTGTREASGKLTQAPSPQEMSITSTPSAVNEVAHPAAAAAAGEAAVLAPTMPDLSSLEVKASPGHGYEYMMKRLWEQLQEKHIALPENANPESDIYKLVHADAGSIDSVVHRIALDSHHNFANADGTSIKIDPTAHISIGADGQLHLGDATHSDMVRAVEGMRTTSSHHLEALTDISTRGSVVASVEVAPPVDTVIQSPLAPVETTLPHPVAHEQGFLVDSAGNHVLDGSGQPIHTGSYENLPETNAFGIEVSATAPHIYADVDAKHLFAYGGSLEERVRMITEYLTQNQYGVIYAEDSSGHRVAWFRDAVTKQITQGPAVRTHGFLGMFESFLKPPGPEEFKNIIT